MLHSEATGDVRFRSSGMEPFLCRVRYYRYQPGISMQVSPPLTVLLQNGKALRHVFLNLLILVVNTAPYILHDYPPHMNSARSTTMDRHQVSYQCLRWYLMIIIIILKYLKKYFIYLLFLCMIRTFFTKKKSRLHRLNNLPCHSHTFPNCT